MCDGLKFESEQGAIPVIQTAFSGSRRFGTRPFHALELGSATGFTKEMIIPQKPPPHDNAERWRDAEQLGAEHDIAVFAALSYADMRRTAPALASVAEKNQRLALSRQLLAYCESPDRRKNAIPRLPRSREARGP